MGTLIVNQYLSKLWTPAQSSPMFWVDASHESLVVDGSNVVTQWGDRSGNNYHTRNDAQPTKRPVKVDSELNGKSIVRFNGNALETLFTPVSSLTVGIVRKTTALPVNEFNNVGFVLDIGTVLQTTPTGRLLQIVQDNAKHRVRNPCNSNAFVDDPIIDFVWRVEVVQLDVFSGIYYYVDGSLIGSSLYNGVDIVGTPSIRLGNGNTWSNTLANLDYAPLGFIGDIAEMVIMPGMFSDSLLTNYLSQKWGL